VSTAKITITGNQVPYIDID